MYNLPNNQQLTIWAVQSNMQWEQIEQNLQLYDKMLDKERLQNPNAAAPHLITLPEMFSTGFAIKNASMLADSPQGATFEWLCKQAQKHQCCMCGSYIVSENKKLYNRFVVVNAEGKIMATYNKRHLFSMSGEEAVFEAGMQQTIFNINGFSIAPQICYDLRFPVWCRRTLAYNYEVLLVVANFPYIRQYAWEQLLIARAIENQSFVVGVNRVGNDGNNIYHYGGSMVLDGYGKFLQYAHTHPAIIKHTLWLKDLMQTRTELPFANDADLFSID